MKTLFIILSFLFIISCTSINEPEELTISGEIYISGNEPFTKLTLRINDSKSYLVESTDKIESYLWKHQGGYFEFVYEPIISLKPLPWTLIISICGSSLRYFRNLEMKTSMLRPEK